MVPGEPHIDGSFALYAVASARLDGASTTELLRAANLIRGSKPDGETTPYLILYTCLLAGDWEGLFETLQELPHDADKVHFESVDSYGDEGLWIWREGSDNSVRGIGGARKGFFCTALRRYCRKR